MDMVDGDRRGEDVKTAVDFQSFCEAAAIGQKNKRGEGILRRAGKSRA